MGEAESVSPRLLSQRCAEKDACKQIPHEFGSGIGQNVVRVF